MSGVAAERWASRVGLAIGLVAAAAIVLAFRIPGGTELPGANVQLASAPVGELTVSPSGPFLRAGDLQPGGATSGRLLVTNIAGTARAVRLHAVADSQDLDAALHIEIAAGRARLFSGTLEALRRGTSPLTLRRGERRLLTIRVSLPAGADGAARAAEIVLQPSTEPATAA